MTPSMPLVNSDTLEAGLVVVPIICPADAVNATDGDSDIKVHSMPFIVVVSVVSSPVV